jgi:hypothetical protein
MQGVSLSMIYIWLSKLELKGAKIPRNAKYNNMNYIYKDIRIIGIVVA